MVQATPVLEKAVGEFITEYIGKENMVREAVVTQNADTVNQRRVAEARLASEKAAREKAEHERDEALTHQKALQEKVEGLMSRMQELEKRVGS
jgi:hypothetical protein